MHLDGLTTEVFGRNCIYLDAVDSTNTYLKKNLSLQDGTVVMTNNQYAGRGRRGNVWVQKTSGSVALSVLIHGANPEDMGILPLLSGMAASQSVPKGQVKWPNDVVIDSKKVCGILCESAILGSNISAICGFGVNLSQSAEEFEQAGLYHAASVLMQTGKEVSSSEMCACIMNNLEKLWCEYKSGGIDDILNRYSKMCVTLGKEVKIIQDGSERKASAVRVNTDGALVCSDESGEFEVRAGDVSVRGLYGYI